ncbi:MAG TPA: tetratricopeptide repeat protein [Polyangiaceae bacterium]
MAAPRIRKNARLILLVSAIAVVATQAVAQSSDPATAEALFDAGRAAFESGDYDSACAKFAESHRLDPAAGTVINLAACNEQRGRLASAWENWREALSMLRSDDERRPSVEKRKAELEARVPRLEVHLAPGTPPGVVVSRDGVALGSAALGLPLPIDPGPHRIEVTAPGRVVRAYDVKAEEGRSVALVVEPGAALPGQGVTAPPTSSQGASKSEPRKDSGPSTTRIVGYGAAGLGVVAIGVGAATGLLALDRKQTIVDTCDKQGDRYVCPNEGVDAADSGKTLATVSTVATISGLALAATGLVLVLTSTSGGPEITATFLPSGGMIGGRGRF